LTVFVQPFQPAPVSRFMLQWWVFKLSHIGDSLADMTKPSCIPAWKKLPGPCPFLFRIPGPAPIRRECVFARH
jgi:hypothetical protein